MQTHSITYRTPRKSNTHNQPLRAGDVVLVNDAISGRRERYQLADVVERDGHLRVRLIGMNFYFAASLVQRVEVRDAD
jgi:hypothetical protein